MQSTVYCPKCSGDMVPVRHSGVLIDRCTDCNGVFLDRGELEKIVALEQQATDRWDDDQENDEEGYSDRDRGGRRRKSRKRSFFEELFDID
ncbi:zf-TFIIB domain-containing protein [soil metagenome]